jgi:hypothetical protein
VFILSHEQQKIFEEEKPDAEGSRSWLSKNTSSTTSTSELSSSEASSVSASASDGDAATPARVPKKTKAKETKKVEKAVSGSDSDAALHKEIKKLQIKTKKAEATADNLKKKLKQDAKLTKALQDKIKALEESLTQSRVVQSDTQISKLLETESKQEHPCQTPPVDSSESGGGLVEPTLRP